MLRAIVLGASGLLGVHMVRRLRQEGAYVHAFDIREPPFGWIVPPNRFEKVDLANPVGHYRSDFDVDWVFNFAADMGGAQYVFTGENDLAIMTNSARININVANRRARGRIFFSSSACVYREKSWAQTQWDKDGPREISRAYISECREGDAYPADPDSNYGWEKLFSERIYQASGKDVRIARYHNIYGEFGVYQGGREKAPAAICRKVAEAQDGGTIEIIGDGTQTRSFLYIDECIEGTLRLMRSDFAGPVNIGSDLMVSINDLVDLVCAIAGKKLTKIYVPGPTGVRGRNSDNTLIREKLGWKPNPDLLTGMANLYGWVEEQVKNRVDTAPEPV